MCMNHGGAPCVHTDLYLSPSITSVISKVVPNSEPKTPVPKTPATKSGPGNRPRTPPPPPILSPVVPPLPPPAPPAPIAPAPSSLLSLGPMMSPATSLKTPVRSVVTETVSTYVVSARTLHLLLSYLCTMINCYPLVCMACHEDRWVYVVMHVIFDPFIY